MGTDPIIAWFRVGSAIVLDHRLADVLLVDRVQGPPTVLLAGLFSGLPGLTLVVAARGTGITVGIRDGTMLTLLAGDVTHQSRGPLMAGIARTLYARWAEGTWFVVPESHLIWEPVPGSRLLVRFGRWTGVRGGDPAVPAEFPYPFPNPGGVGRPQGIEDL